MRVASHRWIHCLVLFACLLPVCSAHAYKTSRWIVPEFKLQEATLEEAVEALRVKSAEVDVLEPDPIKRGVNIIIIGGSPAQRAKKISLELRNLPLKAVVEKVAAMAGMKMRVEAYAVVLVPVDAPDPG